MQVLNYDKMDVLKLERPHIKEIFNKIKLDRNRSNQAYNKNLGYIKPLFTELVEWEIINTSPAQTIKTLPEFEAEIEANKPATDEELNVIIDYLKKTDWNFYVFVSIIYHTGIRPVETTRLKCQMVDVDSGVISIPSANTKNKKNRIVPINKLLKDNLLILNLSDKENYLFGSPSRNGGKITSYNSLLKANHLFFQQNLSYV